jgi:predicted small secreted protein
MRVKWIAVLVIALLVAGCACPTKPKMRGIGEDVFSLEVEDFKLTNANVQNLDKASGGKVVVLQDTSSEAEETIQLSKGDYQITVFSLGTSYDEDAFYLTIGDQSEERLWAESPGDILPTLNPVHFTQKDDGPCRILFRFAEPNVLLDRVQFKRVP